MRRTLIVSGLLLGALAAPPAQACATAPPAGARVAVAAESAIIVWDESTKTEHFLRRAVFRSEAPDFGFLVPTPSKPELAEAPETPFVRLEEAIVPEVVHRRETTIDPMLLCLAFTRRGSKSAASKEDTTPVRVLETKRVGDYDAVVLEADDPGALGDWLKTHGYANRPALEEWLGPYVAKKWKLTAFKIADDAPANPSATLGTRVVRMSFHTDRPFFPYREPRDQRESLPPSLSTERSLRIFFLGAARVAPVIGDGSTVFPGRTVWSGAYAATSIELPVNPPPSTWLTAIEDNASPRPGVDELWLDRAADQSPVKPPPIVLPVDDPIPVPIDVVVVVGVAGFFVVRRVRRARASSRGDSVG